MAELQRYEFTMLSRGMDTYHEMVADPIGDWVDADEACKRIATLEAVNADLLAALGDLMWRFDGEDDELELDVDAARVALKRAKEVQRG